MSCTAWLALTVPLLLAGASAQELTLTGVRLLPGGEFRVEHVSDPASYFILERGATVDRVSRPATLALGRSGGAVLADRQPTARHNFYRVRRVPQSHPLDTDADGIDDVYELRRPAYLDALDPTDAGRDYDGDGRSNLAEYNAGTDPALPDGVVTVYVLDSPAPGSHTEYRELGTAVAYLNDAVSADGRGLVIIATERALSVSTLNLDGDIAIEVAEAFRGKARLTGPGMAPLVINAGRGLGFSGLNVENSGGLVFNAPLRCRLRNNTLPRTQLNLRAGAVGAASQASAAGLRPTANGGISATAIEQNTFLGAFDVTVGGSLGADSSLSFLQNRGPSLNLELQGSVAGEVSLSEEVYKRTGIRASLLLDSKFTISHLQDADFFEFKGYATGKPQLYLEHSVVLETSLDLAGVGEFSAFLRYYRGQSCTFNLEARRQQIEMTDSQTAGDLKVVGRAGAGVSVQEMRMNLERVGVGANLRFELAENENSRFYANLGVVNGLNLIASLHGETYWDLGEGFKLSGSASFVVNQGLIDVKAHGAVFQGGVSIENQHVRASVAGRYEGGSLGPGFELDAPRGVGLVTLEFIGCDFLGGGSIGCWGPEAGEMRRTAAAAQPTVRAPRPAAPAESQILIRGVRTGLKEVNLFDLEVPVTIEDCTVTGKGDLHLSNVKGPVMVRNVQLAEGSVLITDDDLSSAVTVDGVTILGGLAPSLSMHASDAEVRNSKVIGPSGGLKVTTGRTGLVTKNVLSGDNAVLSVHAEAGEVSLQDNEVTGVTSLGDNTTKGRVVSSNNRFRGAFTVSGGHVTTSGDHFTEALMIGGGGVLAVQGDLSGVEIIDLNLAGGLANDPVPLGASPDDVLTWVDFDGDGCADYPPPQREGGQCIRPGVPPPR